jgi:hypothetical protein
MTSSSLLIPSAPACAELPAPRGPVSAALLAALRHPVGSTPVGSTPLGGSAVDLPVDVEDLHLALYLCYELHYRGLPGVDEEWEWDPSLLALRQRLEAVFVADLTAAVGPVRSDAGTVVADLWALATGGDGPSLSGWVLAHGDLGHARELAAHRSAYQLKEADPHTWMIPRLTGDAKAVMVAIQSDEYGDGVADAMHASLFARTMEALGLAPVYNGYVDLLPATTLATTNLISLFGLHRRWRGALVGHLALFEMTSVGPMGRYGRWMDDLGVDPSGRSFYDVHVEADEHHQHMAADGMVGGLVRDEPALAADVIFGARALAAIEGRLTAHLLQAWTAGRSSLRRPLDGFRPS